VNDDASNHGRPDLLAKTQGRSVRKDFRLVVLGVATAEDLRDEVEQKVTSIIESKSPAVETYLFSYSHLRKVHQYMEAAGFDQSIPLLRLDG